MASFDESNRVRRVRLQRRNSLFPCHNTANAAKNSQIFVDLIGKFEQKILRLSAANKSDANVERLKLRIFPAENFRFYAPKVSEQFVSPGQVIDFFLRSEDIKILKLDYLAAQVLTLGFLTRLHRGPFDLFRDHQAFGVFRRRGGEHLPESQSDQTALVQAASKVDFPDLL